MRNIFYLVVFFLIAQFLGIFAGSILLDDYTENPYVQSMYLDSQNLGNSFFNIVLLFAMILLGTAILLFIIKYYKGEILFFLFEFFLIAVPSSIIFYCFARIQFPYLESMVIGIILALIFAVLRFRFDFLRNYAAIFASAAVGAVFGISFSPLFVLAFLILLAIYDYIAVFKTKHMVTLAKAVMKRDMALTISSTTKVPKVGVRRIDLGTGDILAPIMLEVSFLPFNPLASLLVLLSSTLAVFLIFYISRRRKMLIPALPPIIGSIILALLLGSLFGIVTF